MMPRRRLEIGPWPGGLWAPAAYRGGMSLPSNMCPPSHLVIADNLVLGPGGSVRSRPGYSQLSDVLLPPRPGGSAGFVDGLGVVGGSVNPNVFLYDTGGNLWDWAALTIGTASFTYATYNEYKSKFVIFAGRVAHTNGQSAMVDAPVAATGFGAVPAASLGAPISRILHVHNDRVFAANGSTLYETAPGTAPSNAVDNFATGATWSIDPGTGDDIMAVASLDRDLFIFKANKIWIQTGYTKDERQTYVFSDDYGTSSPDSVLTVNFKGLGDCIVFLSSSRVLCLLTRSGIIEISDVSQTRFGSFSFPSPATTAFREILCKITAHPDGYLFIRGGTTGSSGAPANWNPPYCLHTNLPYDYNGRTRWPLTIWKNSTGTTYNSVLNGCWFPFKYKYTNADIDSVAVCRQVAGEVRILYLDFSVWAQADFEGLLATHNEDAGAPDFNKQWCDSNLFMSNDYISPWYVDAYQYNDNVSLVQTYGSPAHVDPDVYSAVGAPPDPTYNVIYPLNFPLSGSSKRTQIVVVGVSGKDPPIVTPKPIKVWLHKIEIFYKASARAGKRALFSSST